MSRKPVLLDVFPTVVVAEMVKDRLSVEGIDAFVADEAMGNLVPGTALGGIRVLVAEDDLAAARDVLANLSQPLGTAAGGISEEDLAVLTAEADAAVPAERPVDDAASERRLVRGLLPLVVLAVLALLVWLLVSRGLLG